MKDNTKYVGLNVSKENISVAIADEGREKRRYYGGFLIHQRQIRKLVKKLGDPHQFQFCYEVGPTGYGLYRMLLSLGMTCCFVLSQL